LHWLWIFHKIETLKKLEQWHHKLKSKVTSQRRLKLNFLKKKKITIKKLKLSHLLQKMKK
jgi:hypothetical protein